MIYTLTDYPTDDPGGKDGEIGGRYLRAPRKAFCPPTGPYWMFGMYLVPSQLYPLSPLAVTNELVDEINAHADYLARTAEESKTMHIVNASNKQLLETIKHGETGHVYPVENWEGELQTIEIGGPSEGAFRYIQILRERLDRQSGLTQLQRGQTTGDDTTATEATIASRSGDARLSYMQNQWRGDVVECIRKAAWFMFSTSAVAFPVPIPREGFAGSTDETEGLEDGEFVGGLTDEQKAQGFEFDDLELEIEPMSMELVDEALLQRRTLQVFQLIVKEIAPAMLQFPFLNWRKLYRDLMEAFNIRDGASYINFEMLEMMLTLKFEAGAMDQIPGIDGAAPVDTEGMQALPGPTSPSVSIDSEFGGGSAVAELAGILGEANNAAA